MSNLRKGFDKRWVIDSSRGTPGSEFAADIDFATGVHPTSTTARSRRTCSQLRTTEYPSGEDS
jgi:hypothetical protein